MSSTANFVVQGFGRIIRSTLLNGALILSAANSYAACDACTTIGAGTSWGAVAMNPLQEASGLAASRRNPGTLWTHNDGSTQNLFAISTNGLRLATLNLNVNVTDVEDIAAGPGPVHDINYLYVGDIGGSANPGDVRTSVKIIRLPEPVIELTWATNPRSLSADGVEVFTLTYPDGSFDAESLLVDPLSGDVYVVTKQSGSARWYRANLNGLANGATTALQFVRAVGFGVASGGDISADGTQIILRREDFALLWERCHDETIDTALSRIGQSVPVVGPPTEPNGEAVALLPDGSGYLSISEGDNPQLYFFQSQCPAVPRFTLEPSDQSAFAGGTAEFNAFAVGYPPPTYQWRFANQALAGQTSPTLTLTAITPNHAGDYEVVISNVHGSFSASATLLVRPKPDLRITEVMSSPATSVAPRADWWELTSFESQPVSLAGWRFNDGVGGLSDPFVLPAGLSIAPRETMVFVETLTATDFRAWWGALNIPANVQIIRYSGSGLSFAAAGDQLSLWDASVVDANDFVVRAVFGSATTGVSFSYDPVTQLFGGLSQSGVNGALVAASGSDLGSPGRILAPVISPVLAGRLVNGQLRIEFPAQVGRTYSLESLSDTGSLGWGPVGDTIVATNNSPMYFETRHTFDRQFFRVVAE